jgi:hypothetical protein
VLDMATWREGLPPAAKSAKLMGKRHLGASRLIRLCGRLGRWEGILTNGNACDGFLARRTVEDHFEKRFQVEVIWIHF